MPHGPEPSTHRFDARADTFEWESFPRREYVDVLFAKVCAQIKRQPFCIVRGCRDHHQRATTTYTGQPCEHERPGWVGHSEQRSPQPGEIAKCWIVVEQFEERSQRHQ